MKNFKLFLIAVLTIALFTQTNSFAQSNVRPTRVIQVKAGDASTVDFGVPKAIGRAASAEDFSVTALKKSIETAKIAALACPTPTFDFTPGKTVNCNAACVTTDIRDSAWTPGAIGEWMQHAALIVFQTDAFNDTQNIFEIWSNGTLILRVGASNTGTGTPLQYFTWAGWFGSSMNSKTGRVWLYGICPAALVEFKMFDSGNNSAVPWYIWDTATNTVKGSGTFTGAGGGTGTFTNWGGSATYTCFSSTGVPCGAAFLQYCGGVGSNSRFCPTSAKVGKYGITYTWNNTLSGANACTATFTDTIEVLPIYKTTWTPPASLCATSSSVSLTSYLDGLSTTGGVWTGSGVSGNNWNTSGLSGNITITYTVGGGTSCESAESHTITVNPKPTVTATASPSSVCATGTANVTLSATGGGTYVWSGGAGSTSSVTVTPSSTTTYTVTVTSSASCTNTGTVTVSISPAPTASLAKVDVKCKGVSTGTITTTAGAGTTPFTYSWSNSATTQNLSGLSNGTYNLTVTDNKGCTATSAVTLTEPSAAVSLPTPTATATGCGASTGTATASGSGGTGSLTYLWNPGSKTGAAITGLAAGTYVVTVTDANGCSATGSATVAPPTGGPTIAIDSQKDLKCNGDVNGNAYTSATGGSGNFSYTWSTGTTGSGSSSSIINVAAGTYIITYTDVNSACSNTKTVTITEPAAYSMAPAITNILCKGAKTGAIDITPTGNTPSYTFDWSPNNATTEDITGLNPGTYTLSITDSKGCTKTFSYSVTEPALGISVTADSTQTSCGASTGTATATAGGGTGSLTYSWTGGKTGAAITGLASGTYIVTVTDASGCSKTDATTVGNANGPTASATKTDASCGSSDGTATASGTGGTGALTYAWSTGSTAATINGLAAGTYNVTVTDANGCTSTAAATVGSSNPPTVTATKVDAACGQSNGTATANGSGGTGALTYVWSNFALGNVATGLGAGTYTVVVSDSKGCTSITTVNITSAGGPTAGLTASKYIGESPLVVDFTNTSTGGTTYTWYFGDGSAPYTGTTPPTHTYTTDGKFYACVVANAGGCKDSTCKDITVSGFKIAVPNIITPNGDKKNDVFVITTKGVTKLDITVWDRWGLLMWEGTGVTPDAITGFINTWEGKTTSGKECPDGTYYFMLKAYKFDGDIVEDKGFISLVR